jgi:2-hydroxy-3-keto-5-methylthiopentenyl-1-phosphate phosphatase
MNSNWAIVSDFDGTISQHDMADNIYYYFGAATREDIRQSYEGGEKVEDWIARCLKRIKADHAEVERYILDFGRPRAGAPELIQYCRANGVPFEIASGGLDLYIDLLLKKWELGGEKYTSGRVKRNSAGSYDVSYDHMFAQAPDLESFKAFCVRKYQEQGYKVIFCGDGNSDFKAALQADMVFARYKLTGLCAAAGRRTRRLDFRRILDFLKAGT